MLIDEGHWVKDSSSTAPWSYSQSFPGNFFKMAWLFLVLVL